MKLPGSSRTRLALAIGVAALLALSIAGYLALRSDSDSSNVPSQEPGDTSGLLPASSLPGPGWAPAVDSELSYIAPGLVIFSIPAMPECASLRAFEERLQEADSEFASGVIRRFVRSGDSGPAATVAHLRVAFTDEAIPARLVDEFQRSARGSATQSCVAAIVRRDGVDADVATSDVTGGPSGSVGTLTTVTMKATPAVISASQVFVWWAEGETLAVVSIATAGQPPVESEVALIAEQAAIATRKAPAR